MSDYGPLVTYLVVQLHQLFLKGTVPLLLVAEGFDLVEVSGVEKAYLYLHYFPFLRGVPDCWESSLERWLHLEVLPVSRS